MKKNSISFLAFLTLLVIGCRVCAGADITVRIVDEGGSITPARAWVDVGSKRLFRPESPGTVTPYERDRSFSCDGVFTMEVPKGSAVIHIEKGKEFVPVNLSVEIGEEGEIEKTITIKRWINMPQQGWYSADLHVHLGHDDPRVLQQLALADDVHLVPAFTYWLRGRGETWEAGWPDDTYTNPIKVDDQHLITRNNIEVERINSASIPGGFFGATFLYHLNLPVTAGQYGEHYPTDAALCRIARKHSPAAVFDCDKPTWAVTAITAALGTLDTVQVCHNHYHRESTISGGWGMIGPLTPDESNAAADDKLFYRTNALYYRLLNCGFRLGVSGGSAIGVMPVATGQHRAYARVEGQFTADKYWEAVKAGRSFATSGPMIDLKVGGKGIGSTLKLTTTDPTPLICEASVGSIDSLESLQIIQNGEVLATINLPGGQNEDEVIFEALRCEIIPKRSGWVVARALFLAPDGRLRQAHTSPVYLSIDEKPVAFADDAQYMLRWVAVLDKIARTHSERFPSTAIQEEVLADYDEARSRYRRILLEAKTVWGD